MTNASVEQLRQLLERDGKPAEAIETASKLLEQNAQKDQELSLDMAPVWYLYGRALLAQCQADTNIFGGGVVQGADSTDDDDDDDDDELSTVHEGDDAVVDDIDDNDGESEADGEERDQDDYETAWQAFETARVIYVREIERKPELVRELISVHEALGELSTETEQFDLAVEEYSHASALWFKLAAEDSFYLRNMAETYFKIAVVHELNQKFQDAVDAMAKAKALLMKRKFVLEMQCNGELSPAVELSDDQQKQLAQDKAEVEDLVAILQDMNAKQEELEAQEKAEPVTVELPPKHDQLPGVAAGVQANILAVKKQSTVPVQSAAPAANGRKRQLMMDDGEVGFGGGSGDAAACKKSK